MTTDSIKNKHIEGNILYVAKQKSSEIYSLSQQTIQPKGEDNFPLLEHLATLEPCEDIRVFGDAILLFQSFQLKVIKQNKTSVYPFTTQFLSSAFE